MEGDSELHRGDRVVQIPDKAPDFYLPLDSPDPSWGLWGRGAVLERSNGSSSKDVSSSLSKSGFRRKVGAKVRPRKDKDNLTPS